MVLKPQGTFLLLGYPAYIEVDWSPMMAKEIKIITSNIFGHDIIDGKTMRTMQIAVDLISSGKINVKDFVTHKFNIEDYKEALEVAENKSKYNAVKVVFQFE